MECKKCGSKLDNESKFCMKCGEKVDAKKSHIVKTKFCEYCGAKKEEGDSKFCQNCGNSTSATSHSVNINTNQEEMISGSIIKCGNCEYIGPGEKARSTWAKILAWVCIIFAPLITIIYFVATFKYQCPKCKSTFLGIKNKEGVFNGQRGGAGRIVMIFIVVLVGIAIIGILASIVLASLNSARSKGQDASIKATLSSVMPSAELYWDSQSTNNKDGSYLGFCNSSSVVSAFSSLIKVKETIPICNDSKEEYAVSSLLNSGKYWCVDSLGDSIEIEKLLGSRTYCSTEMTLEIMQQVAAEANKDLPQMVDSETRLDSVSGIENGLTYKYTLVNFNLSDLENVKLSDSLKGDMVKNICSSSDMKIYIENKSTLYYSYYDKNGMFIETIPINTGTDCK